MQKVLIHQTLLKKAALGNLKSDLDKLGIDELKNVSSNLKQFEM